ncbi:MotA/TolQ/ExbB proton channel family protein [Leptolyngbya cf. ectocarpi LEGE 11479]|uniref:MotA/TolQ/ExbB proton channel family protein n=1 Tax=Leptolyngbya cf. ectocarpi LEGE 11479 TaxID=1828722 RepID=A0A928ZZN7_LEPEC|nr:MotA/TolQ/ExbB proton channel family protein [Leptolyngbya ectocarpi]MBE9070363.1 MotA/TolQ/ExbB proton channel family protein [Leptolyngbya cf. ectocarpi LEGE 11479]
MSFTEIFQAGGIVMWPLVLFSLIAIALSTERLIFWLRINRNQRKVVKKVLATYRRAPMDVFALLRQSIHLPISRIFLEALELESPSPSQFRLALESATQAELPLLKRFNTIFQTIITVSPLLGLLGTILGLIRSFDAIEIGGIGSNAEAVTGGISEALVSTAAGMVVAIFTLLFANLFRGLYKRQIALLQEHGGQLELLYEDKYTHKIGTPEYANS